MQKPDQLLSLAHNSDIILNCVGPYRFTGENVVAACVSAGTDYLDVSGEPGNEYARTANSVFLTLYWVTCTLGELGDLDTVRAASQQNRASRKAMSVF